MELTGISFFCYKESPVVKIVMAGPHWEYRINLGGIDIYVNEQHLIDFKNSVISEYERVRREKDGKI